MKKLLVFTVVKIRDYRNPIIDLVPEAVGRIVNYQYIFYINPLEDPQVFYKNPVWRFSAVLSVQS